VRPIARAATHPVDRGAGRVAAARLDHRQRLLTRNRDALAPARQQTLRAALEWSHGLLEER